MDVRDAVALLTERGLEDWQATLIVRELGRSGMLELLPDWANYELLDVVGVLWACSQRAGLDTILRLAEQQRRARQRAEESWIRSTVALLADDLNGFEADQVREAVEETALLRQKLHLVGIPRSLQLPFVALLQHAGCSFEPEDDAGAVRAKIHASARAVCEAARAGQF